MRTPTLLLLAVGLVLGSLSPADAAKRKSGVSTVSNTNSGTSTSSTKSWADKFWMEQAGKGNE